MTRALRVGNGSHCLFTTGRTTGGGEEARGQAWRTVPRRLQKRAGLQAFVSARTVGDRSVATETAAGAGVGFSKGAEPLLSRAEALHERGERGENNEKENKCSIMG